MPKWTFSSTFHHQIPMWIPQLPLPAIRSAYRKELGGLNITPNLQAIDRLLLFDSPLTPVNKVRQHGRQTIADMCHCMAIWNSKLNLLTSRHKSIAFLHNAGRTVTDNWHISLPLNLSPLTSSSGGERSW